MGTTPKHQLPYPEPTDRVSDGAAAMRALAEATEAAIAPTGAVLPYAGTTAPANWLLCDGAAVSRATYADLFALIGTTFGAGDGSSTFNLPDMRGRHPVGVNPDATQHAKSVGLTELGTIAGVATTVREGRLNHTHSHTINDTTHNQVATTTTGGTATRLTGPDTHNHGAATGSKALNDSASSNHAFLTLAFIIRT